jgi:glycosyltransferase involved in cell wall biosynthesis
MTEQRYKAQPSEYDTVLVSVIMPVYNRAYCIQKAIESICLQTHQNWELLIIDDGSTDNLPEIKKEYSHEKRIKFSHKPWGGVSQSRNQGLEMAQGDYIFYLDTDNMWQPHFLQTMIVFMKTGKLDVAYSGLEIVDDNQKTIGYYGEKFVWDECWELNHVDINSLGHSRFFADKGYRFDESLKRFVDWDFILNITLSHRTAYAPFLGVTYYDGQLGNRITFTEFTGDDVNELKNRIHKKHLGNVKNPLNRQKSLRPEWKQIYKP